MKEINILFTSAGRRAYLISYFKKALASENVRGTVHAANSSAMVSSFLEADRTVVTPPIYTPAYIPFLLDYCRKNRITAVMSLLDTDLPVLSEHKAQFDEIGTQLLVADHDMVVKCNDKFATFKLLSENGIATPRTFIDADALLRDIEAGELSFPVVIKARWGTGSFAFFTPRDEEELRVLARYAAENVKKSFLRFESAQDAENCVVFQEFINGAEYGLDVINDLNGNYVGTIAKRKLGMRSGETDCATIVNDERISAIGEKLGRLVGHPAVMDADVLRSEKGDYYVLEMNARFGGGYPFGHVAGADVPRAIIRWLKGENGAAFCQASEGVTAQKDITMVSYR